MAGGGSFDPDAFDGVGGGGGGAASVVYIQPTTGPESSLSEVSIANAALVKLGADLIIDLNEDNNRARALNARYRQVRDAELRRRRWKFSIRRASLPALTTAPLSGFKLAYQLPVDFLRLINGGQLYAVADLSDTRNSAASSLYAIEGRTITTNLGAPLDIRYLARITDPSLYDDAFAEAFAARLAFECCERITQSDSKKQLCWSDYRNSIKEAITANSIESPPDYQPDDTWVVARSL